VIALLIAFAPAPASAQFFEPEPGSGESGAEPTPAGRVPRQPRGPTSTIPPGSADTGSPSTSDGHEHSETGSTPPAPVGVARSRVRSHVDTGDERAVALTLDDGFRPDPRILELIRSYGIHGTAFIVGEVAETNPGLINELAQLGWLVCSHTYDHELLTGRSLEAIRSEIVRGAEAVEEVVGYRCPYFRAPYGAVDANVVAVTDELGLEIIGWEASLSDSAPAGTDPELQLSIAQRDLRPGSILLGHFGATNSYEVLSRLLAWLADEGYSVGSVAELIAGNTTPLRQIGNASVTVDLDGSDEPSNVLAPASARPATPALPFAGLDTVAEMAGIGAAAALVRRRRLPRRRRLQSTELPVLADTLPPWEAGSAESSVRGDAPLVGG
jgi:peptidoglycan/xylan/chitin deacetylase (PgdA/CDA1 family)